MSKQQTAVEFLVNELESILELYNSEWDEVYRAAAQAKAMEKHQTLVFGMKCQGDYNKYDFHRNIVDIYNETYNK